MLNRCKYKNRKRMHVRHSKTVGVQTIMLKHPIKHKKRTPIKPIYSINVHKTTRTQTSVFHELQVQGLTTYGATDVKHFIASEQLYLAITNSLDDSSRSDIRSFIYTWNSATSRFSVSPNQQIATLYARAVEVFVIDGVVYLAVANFYDRTSGSYEIE